jgi:hypothetical protein
MSIRKQKLFIVKIRKLEASKKINIPREISIDTYNRYLKEWERTEIRVKT